MDFRPLKCQASIEKIKPSTEVGFFESLMNIPYILNGSTPIVEQNQNGRVKSRLGKSN